jgi:formylglycine-generating enzyme required for sulfatase activity
MSHIFISYSHKDKEYVHKLHEALKNEGFDVWIDDRIDYGDKWLQAIEKNLDECDAFIIVMSKNSYESEMVQNEITRARDLEKQIFPLLLDGRNWLVVQSRQFVDVRDGSLPTEKFYKRLETVTQRTNERAEREATEKVALEQARREATEKAKYGRAQGQAAQIAASKETIAKSFSALRSHLPKANPFLRIAGISGIAIALIWASSWGLPKLASLVPTVKASLTSTLRPSLTFTISPQPPTKTLTPKLISTKTRTPVPTSVPTEIIDANGVAMVLVPAGEFIMGSEDGDEDEKPVREVYLDAFYIDKHEVTNSLYKECVDSDVCIPPELSNDFDGRKYYGDIHFEDYPVTYIEWDQADTYCSWREAKLPTEAQWEKAARGTDGRTFPWGESINCNLANYNPACVGGMKKVGSYESGKSLYGIYDLAGNVWEWVADWYSPTYYQNFPISNPLGPENGEFRILRGGAWNTEMSKARASYRFDLSSIYFYRGFGESVYWPSWAATPVGANLAYYAGFRCARDVIP